MFKKKKKSYSFPGCICHILAWCHISCSFTHDTSFLYSALPVTPAWSLPSCLLQMWCSYSCVYAYCVVLYLYILCSLWSLLPNLWSVKCSGDCANLPDCITCISQVFHSFFPPPLLTVSVSGLHRSYSFLQTCPFNTSLPVLSVLSCQLFLPGCCAGHTQGLADHQQHWHHERRSQGLLVHPLCRKPVLVQRWRGEALTFFYYLLSYFSSSYAHLSRQPWWGLAR